MNVDLYTQKGNKAKTQIEVADSLIAKEVNEPLLAQYVFVYLSNQRESIAHTKDRSEVSGGGAKPWRQKGTGRARHGSRRSPIWKGGGVTFGPTNEVNWKKNMSKKMRKLALLSAFSKMYAADKMVFVEDLTFEAEKMTKQGLEFAKALNAGKKFTVVVGLGEDTAPKAFANIKGAMVTSVGELNPYAVLNAGKLFITKSALDFMQIWA
jgi:large subunit ribosomal protein L4